MVLENQGAEILGHDELHDEKVSADHTAESEKHVGCDMES
jgi:hypothetical protein